MWKYQAPNILVHEVSATGHRKNELYSFEFNILAFNSSKTSCMRIWESISL
jgi:hypothetical protein